MSSPGRQTGGAAGRITPPHEDWVDQDVESVSGSVTPCAIHTSPLHSAQYVLAKKITHNAIDVFLKILVPSFS